MQSTTSLVNGAVSSIQAPQGPISADILSGKTFAREISGIMSGTVLGAVLGTEFDMVG